MRYIKQDLFNACSLGVAMAHFAGESMVAASSDLGEQYSGDYQDTRLCDDFLRAGEGLVQQLLETYGQARPASELVQVCHILSAANLNFNPDGTRKRRKLLGGTRFNYEKKEIPKKVERCLHEVYLYQLALSSGKIDQRSVGSI